MHSAYMTSLAALVRACNREIDRAQLGQAPSADVVDAVVAVVVERRRILQDGFELETKDLRG